MGTLSKLRRLVLREGMSVREAAQRLGIARNTASRWLALVDVTEPRYPKRVPAKSILEPYKDQIVETGNQSWRFRSSSAKAKVAKPSRTKQSKGEEGTAVLTDLSTIL